MAGHLHRSQPATAARHGLGQWHDLKRDWQRWSRAERIAAECVAGLIFVTAAVALAGLPF